MTLNLTDAKTQLAALTSGSYTVQDLLNLVRQVDVAAEGNVTVLYSGTIDGIRSADVATSMAGDASIRILDKTAAAKLFISDEFQTALGATAGLTLE